MKTRSFLAYNVDLKKQDAHMDDFKTLSLKQQKEHLLSLLNMNQLYVPLSAMKDKAYGVTAEEARITADFYQLKK